MSTEVLVFLKLLWELIINNDAGRPISMNSNNESWPMIIIICCCYHYGDEKEEGGSDFF